jgi:hypothetical protein
MDRPCETVGFSQGIGSAGLVQSLGIVGEAFHKSMVESF